MSEWLREAAMRIRAAERERREREENELVAWEDA
jgi:hypothetical protein